MARTRLHFDYEGLSELDLTVVGADLYTRHPSTKITMCAFKLDDGKTEQWLPSEGERMPSDLKEALRDPDVLKIAFNAQFERLMTWRLLGIDDGNYEPWRCSMALAYMFSFMGGLDDVAAQMKLNFVKSPRGKQLIKIFCGPNVVTKNQPYVWRDQHSDPELWQEFKDYNIRDTDSEHELWSKLSRFYVPEDQWELYALDQIINDRGLPINRQFVQNALEIAEQRKAELISEQNRITGLANSNSGQQLLPWLQDRGFSERDLQKDNIVKFLTTEEEAVRDGAVLSRPEWTYVTVRDKKGKDKQERVVVRYNRITLDQPPTLNNIGQVVGDATLTSECRDVLRMRQSSSKTSTTKYEATMVSLADDDRLRHCFQFAGASRTNRWAGRKIQPQNLPRTPKWLEPESYINFDRLDYCNSLIMQKAYGKLGIFAGDQMDAVAACVRSAIQAPKGKKLVVCDLSSIESVVIFWLTECERGLQVFRDGRDPYKDFATSFYNVAYEAVTKAMRTMSKPAVLGAGYRLGGGELYDGKKGGLWGYAEGMGVKMTKEEAHKAVAIFRETYSEIKDGWYQIEDVIERAMCAGGRPVKWGPLTFQVEKPFLKVTLPSGRPMWYYKLQVEKQEVDGKYGKYWRTNITYMGKDQVTNQWTRIESHGGKFIENFVQAIARDILAMGMLMAHKMGFYLVGHVHDEIISEEDEHDETKTWEVMRDCMTTHIQALFDWLKTMPLGAAGYEGPIYKKD
jgi:DNA polymerase